MHPDAADCIVALEEEILRRYGRAHALRIFEKHRRRRRLYAYVQEEKKMVHLLVWILLAFPASRTIISEVESADPKDHPLPYVVECGIQDTRGWRYAHASPDGMIEWHGIDAALRATHVSCIAAGFQPMIADRVLTSSEDEHLAGGPILLKPITVQVKP